jgi:DOPA 4,5-dioxygenase
MIDIEKFHAHIYFDEKTVDFARELWEKAKKDFESSYVGRFHETLVGPHLKWNFMIGFTKEDFLKVNNWLMNFRKDLEVLVHADTGYDLIDHTERCFWYGQNIGVDKSKLDPDPE